MIPSPASHDNTLVDQLSSVTITQPVDTDTNESSVENKICNIKTKVSHLIGNIPRDSYKRLKAAGKYTYETIDAHPRITASIAILSGAVTVALLLYQYKLCGTRIASSPIIDASTVIAALITALVTLAITAYNYTTYLGTSHTRIVAAKLMLAAMSVSIVATAALITYSTLELCNFDLNGKEEFTT